MAYVTKNRFFQSSRYRYTNSTTEKETSNQCQFVEKKFRITCGAPEIIAKISIFALPRHLCVRSPTGSFFGTAKIENFAIISGAPEVVLKPFQGQTNTCLMFLFPWFDWCIDILDFEKIQIFVSRAIFGVFSQAILGPNLKLNLWALCVFSQGLQNILRSQKYSTFVK